MRAGLFPLVACSFTYYYITYIIIQLLIFYEEIREREREKNAIGKPLIGTLSITSCPLHKIWSVFFVVVKYLQPSRISGQHLYSSNQSNQHIQQPEPEIFSTYFPPHYLCPSVYWSILLYDI